MHNRPGLLHNRTAWPLARCATGLKCIMTITMHIYRYLPFKTSLPLPKSLSCGTRAWLCLLPRYATGSPVMQRAIRLCIRTGVGHPCRTYIYIYIYIYTYMCVTMHDSPVNYLFGMFLILDGYSCVWIVRQSKWIQILFQSLPVVPSISEEVPIIKVIITILNNIYGECMQQSSWLEGWYWQQGHIDS